MRTVLVLVLALLVPSSAFAWGDALPPSEDAVWQYAPTIVEGTLRATDTTRTIRLSRSADDGTTQQVLMFAREYLLNGIKLIDGQGVGAVVTVFVISAASDAKPLDDGHVVVGLRPYKRAGLSGYVFAEGLVLRGNATSLAKRIEDGRAIRTAHQSRIAEAEFAESLARAEAQLEDAANPPPATSVDRGQPALDAVERLEGERPRAQPEYPSGAAPRNASAEGE